MAGSALNTTYKAIYDALTADTALMALVTGVYDDVPTDAVYPYLVLGESTEGAEDTFDKDGREGTVTVHIWSEVRGWKEALDIFDAANVVLHGMDISTAAWTGWLRLDDAQTLRVGELRHVPARYRSITEEV